MLNWFQIVKIIERRRLLPTEGIIMKKRKKLKEAKVSLSNPVAKFAYQFNKSKIFKDKTKYQRKAKHKESFPIMLFSTFIGKDFFI